MNKTREHKTEQKISVDILTLQDMLCVGRTTAENIGKNANAVISIGRRKLYNVSKIQTYLDNLAAGGKTL